MKGFLARVFVFVACVLLVYYIAKNPITSARITVEVLSGIGTFFDSMGE